MNDHVVFELMTELELWADADGNHPTALFHLDFVPPPRTTLFGAVERSPRGCVNNHVLAYPNYRSSWLPCTCAGPEHGHGHRVVGCVECGHEWFYPPHTDTTATALHWATHSESAKCWCMGGPTTPHLRGMDECDFADQGTA